MYCQDVFTEGWLYDDTVFIHNDCVYCVKVMTKLVTLLEGLWEFMPKLWKS